MPIYVDEVTNTIPGPIGGIPLGTSQKVTVSFDRESGLTATDGTVLKGYGSFFFITEAQPLYADVDYITLNGGEIFESVPEAMIYSLSYAASTMVDDIVLFDVNQHFPDHNSIAWRFFNRARTEFVKCKASAEVLRAIVSSRGMNTSRKMLADFSIDKAAQAGLLSSARPLIKEYIDCFQYWQKVLFAGGKVDFESPMGQVAVKAGWATDGFGGIGRGWLNDSDNLNYKMPEGQQGNKMSRPRRFGNRFPMADWHES